MRRIDRALLLALAAAARLSAQPADTSALRISLRQAAAAGRGAPLMLLAVATAQGSRDSVALALAPLLPNIDITATHTTVSVAAQAQGFYAPNIPRSPIPPLIGPWQDEDARPTVALTLFDLGAVRTVRAASAVADAAAFDTSATGDDLADTAAALYLTLASDEARLRSRVTELNLADTLLLLARVRYQAGIAPELDTIRAANAELAAATRATNDQRSRDSSRVRLLRIIQQPMSRRIVLTDTLALLPPGVPDNEDSAAALALARRSEVHAAEARVRAAKQLVLAARDRWVPTLSAEGDFGWNGRWLFGGNRPDNPIVGTQTLIVGARWPLFDGGRREGEIASSHAAELETRAGLRDVRQRVESDARVAATHLAYDRTLVTNARRELTLAESEVADVTARYRREIASSLDLVQAETDLANAHDDLIAALLNYNLDRVRLLRALGRMDAL